MRWLQRVASSRSMLKAASRRTRNQAKVIAFLLLPSLLVNAHSRSAALLPCDLPLLRALENQNPLRGYKDATDPDVLPKAHGPSLVWGRGEIIRQRTCVWVLRSLGVTPKEDKMVGPWSLSLLTSSIVVGVLLCGGSQSNQGLEAHKL